MRLIQGSWSRSIDGPFKIPPFTSWDLENIILTGIKLVKIPMCSIHSLHHNFFSISLWSEIFSRTVCTLCRLSLKSAVKYKFWQKDCLLRPSSKRWLSSLPGVRHASLSIMERELRQISTKQSILLVRHSIREANSEATVREIPPISGFWSLRNLLLRPSVFFLRAPCLVLSTSVHSLHFVQQFRRFFSPWFQYLHGLWCAMVIFQILTKNV